ncbi:hypothetical protein GF318_02695 [Candidatus Micrarchaeota archaeon]|nr:hypothetical protein [Candidatus Micrarchaeota archaeon]
MRILALALLMILFCGCMEQPQEVAENNQSGTSPHRENISTLQAPAPVDSGMGCEYGNPGCGDEYECRGNRCVLKQGCEFSYPRCPRGYSCENNSCIFIQDEGHPGCYYDDSLCGDREFCVNNNCVESAIKEHPGCGFNEVLVEGECTDASYTIHFVSNGLTSEEFDELVGNSVAAFVYHTPLVKCPEKLRVHKSFQPCREGNSFLAGGTENVTVYLYNRSETFTECSIASHHLVSISVEDMETAAATSVHELGHSLGLWDQYCYWPVPENPNPVDFEKAGCSLLEEGDCMFSYCSNPDRLPEGTAPHKCIGNSNYLGGVTVMGLRADPSRVYSSHPKFGFTESGYEYVAEKITCN